MSHCWSWITGSERYHIYIFGTHKFALVKTLKSRKSLDVSPPSTHLPSSLWISVCMRPVWCNCNKNKRRQRYALPSEPHCYYDSPFMHSSCKMCLSFFSLCVCKLCIDFPGFFCFPFWLTKWRNIKGKRQYWIGAAGLLIHMTQLNIQYSVKELSEPLPKSTKTLNRE